MNGKFPIGVGKFASTFYVVAFCSKFINGFRFRDVVGEAFDNDFKYSFLEKGKCMEFCVEYR